MRWGVSSANVLLARVSMAFGDAERALEHAERAYALYEEGEAYGAPELLDVYRGALLATDQPERAAQVHEEALAWIEGALEGISKEEHRRAFLARPVHARLLSAPVVTGA